MICISLSLSEKIIQNIDSKRGDASRSLYVRKILEKSAIDESQEFAPDKVTLQSGVNS
jgi:hypothetical protein